MQKAMQAEKCDPTGRTSVGATEEQAENTTHTLVLVTYFLSKS